LTPEQDRTGIENNSTWSDTNIQTALITAVKCLIHGVFSDINRIGKIFGHVYRNRIGLDYTMKIFDWIRMAKISDRFNTTTKEHEEIKNFATKHYTSLSCL